MHSYPVTHSCGSRHVLRLLYGVHAFSRSLLASALPVTKHFPKPDLAHTVPSSQSTLPLYLLLHICANPALVPSPLGGVQ